MVKRGGVHETAADLPAGVFSLDCCCLRKTCLTAFSCCGLDGDITNFLLRTLRLNPFLAVE